MVGAAPDEATLRTMAVMALSRVPAPFADHLRDVVIDVVEFAEAEILGDLEIDDKWDLTGLYQGVPLTEQSLWDPMMMPPRVTLFRQPLLAEWCETGVTLEALITHVVIHEIGHHFGLSDEDMDALESQVG